MNKKRLTAGIIFLVIALAIDVFAIVESAIGGSGSGAQSSRFANFILNIVKVFDPNTTLTINTPGFQNFIRKFFGHFLLFGGSGLFTTLGLYLILLDKAAKPIISISILSALIGLALASITEVIQLFTPGRAGLIADVFIDWAGYVLFGGIVIFIILIKSFLKRRKESEQL